MAGGRGWQTCYRGEGGFLWLHLPVVPLHVHKVTEQQTRAVVVTAHNLLKQSSFAPGEDSCFAFINLKGSSRDDSSSCGVAGGGTCARADRDEWCGTEAVRMVHCRHTHCPAIIVF